MDSNSTELLDIEEIARQVHAGIDVSEHFTGDFKLKQNVTVALPLYLLRRINVDCKRQHVDLQTWLEAACAQKIDKARIDLIENG